MSCYNFNFLHNGSVWICFILESNQEKKLLSLLRSFFVALNSQNNFEVVANNVQFVESKRSQDNGVDVSPPEPKNDPLPELAERLAGFEQMSDDDDIPF